ncbi:MAG: PilZ domain-containing protein [Novosphingobium sp.]
MVDLGPNPAEQQTGLDRREEQRLVLLLRPAKLLCRSGEYLCILRDVASKGARLRLFHPLPAEAHMVLELSNGDRYDVEKVWERDDQAGFVFQSNAPLDHLLEERSRFRKRPLRARIALDATITANGVAALARIKDISQQGGNIECEAAFARDQRVSLTAPGLGKVDAKVRWKRGTRVGLVFEQTFRLDQLARLLFDLQPISPALPEECDAVFSQAAAR